MAHGGPPPGHPHYRPPPPPVGPFSPDKQHSDKEKWICLYPAYINSNKSRSQGRVMPKSCCVPDPTYLEIREVLATAGEGWEPIVENKQYPRERSRELEFRGRIRVQLRNDDGSFKNEKFKSSESTKN